MKELFDEVRSYINARKIGSEILVKELQVMYKLINQQTNHVDSVIAYCSLLVRFGYLERGKVKGVCIIKKHIENDLKPSELFRAYSTKSDELQEKLNKQIGGSHYKKVKKQPIEVIVECNLSFIQGNILKYVTRYKDKNGIEDLQKAIHYAEFGMLFKNNVKIRARFEEAVAKYCFTNNLSTNQTKAIKNAIVCNWQETIDLCKIMIDDANKVI